MNYPSPRTPGSTPVHEWDYSRMPSATPTPSPYHNWFESTTPRRPSTRGAHARANSYSQHGGFSPRTHLESPRCNSHGDYCTVDVSPKDFSSSRRPPGASHTSPRRERRHSYTYVRASTPYGESDEDEIFEALGRTFKLPAQSRSKGRHHAHHHGHHHQHVNYSTYEGGWYTNGPDYSQSSPYYYADPVYVRTPQYDSPQRPPTTHAHARRSSTANVPQRPSTARPTTTSRAKPPPSAKATDADARRHGIPAGYSLKNWDPNEEPILLLGSVFDANSLGKWMYDWTVYKVGAGSPISEMAGDLWLLIIKLAGQLKRAEQVVGRVRNPENKDIIIEFIDAGERLTDRLRKLLKASEEPMLKAAKKKGSGLGKNSGVEFVLTLFDRDRELAKTEKFMQSVRLFNLRFDANCDDIIMNPSM